MKKAIFLLLTLITFLTNTSACLNGETKMLHEGTILSHDAEEAIIPGVRMYSDLDYGEKLKELDKLWKKTSVPDYLSDYGLVLVLMKEYKKAKKVFLKLEGIVPGRYATAANLGTVYE